MRERKSLFIFLMGLAWKFRFSMPLLLSSTVAMLGRAWMFQIRVQTVQSLHENEELEYREREELYHRYPRQLEYHPDELEYREGEELYHGYPQLEYHPDMSYYDDDDDGPEDEGSTWDSGSSSSWETLVEEEAYG